MPAVTSDHFRILPVSRVYFLCTFVQTCFLANKCLISNPNPKLSVHAQRPAEIWDIHMELYWDSEILNCSFVPTRSLCDVHKKTCLATRWCTANKTCVKESQCPPEHEAKKDDRDMTWNKEDQVQEIQNPMPHKMTNVETPWRHVQRWFVQVETQVDQVSPTLTPRPPKKSTILVWFRAQTAKLSIWLPPVTQMSP